MSGGEYIPKLNFNPTKTPSKEQIIDKLEKYFIKEIKKYYGDN